MKKVTTLLSTLALATTLAAQNLPVTDATIWLNGTSFVPTDAILANGQK